MQNSLFDLANRYANLSKMGDPLERLNAIIDCAIFCPSLERMDTKVRKSNAGRKPICRILMFKMLVLQNSMACLTNACNTRSQTACGSCVFWVSSWLVTSPMHAPIWAFREALKEHQLTDALFDRLNQALADLGIELKSGQIIDATFVPVPIQRNGRENNALIKPDAVPIEWGQDAEQPNKLAHKDLDSRWTKKGGQNHYGYKNHINIDKDIKLIASHACTDASVHDSQVLEAVLRGENVGGKEVWADSAYRSEDKGQSR